MNIVILAAGQGKRMRSRLPKVLQPLAGRPMLSHVIAAARVLAEQQPNPRIVLVVGHGAQEVQSALAAEADLGFAMQMPQLGTGHAVMQAVPQLADDAHTLVLLGDVPLISAQTLQKLVIAAGRDVGLLTVEMADPTGYGRIVRAGGSVARIVEQKDASAAELAIREVNTGIMVLPTRQLRGWLAELSNDNSQGEYYLTDVIAMAVRDGVSVNAVHPASELEVLGINSKAQLAEVERAYQRQVADALLEQGVTLADPARIDVRGELKCDTDVAIDIGCVFEGRVVLGEGVSIGAHCVLRDVAIAPGAVVLPFSHLDGASVGAGARIGPYARLRPGTTLGPDTHVGNFVEIKASSLGAGSKANHLAYVGDAEVGARVNIGAGTITCNYDGANKFKTIIEDEVFIGSDTQLVAPVRVGRGATLGAGTTLTKNAPAGELTISRAKQMTIPG
ncbi:MAG: bifunctional UDP-N-acetylglucosamine diphosphorylase/glucosamine-1-phosphate N-acetyltransferase GlmU, partial [Burkholderiaceae bacterium]